MSLDRLTALQKIQSICEVEPFTIEYENIQVQAYRHGHGPHLILTFPSFPFSGLYYLWLFSEIDKTKYSLVTFDIPGWTGLTPPIKRKPFKVGEVVSIAEKLTASLGHYDKISLVGYSFGGSVAVELADKLNGLVDNIILVSPVIEGKVFKSSFFFRLFRLVCSVGLEDYVRPYFIYRFNRITRKSTLPKKELDIYKQLLNQLDSDTMIESVRSLSEVDYLETLSRLESQVGRIIVISSREERKFFRRQAERIRRKLRHEKSIYLHGSHDDFVLKPNEKVVKEIYRLISE